MPTDTGTYTPDDVKEFEYHLGARARQLPRQLLGHRTPARRRLACGGVK